MKVTEMMVIQATQVRPNLESDFFRDDPDVECVSEYVSK